VTGLRLWCTVSIRVYRGRIFVCLWYRICITFSRSVVARMVLGWGPASSSEVGRA